MRIAVMTERGGLEDRVSYHFGRAPTITIIECDGEAKLVKVMPNPHGGRGGFWQLLDALRSEGVEVVIAENMGPGALRNLASAGIRVYRAPGMRVDEAARALMKGELESIEEACEEHKCEGHED